MVSEHVPPNHTTQQLRSREIPGDTGPRTESSPEPKSFRVAIPNQPCAPEGKYLGKIAG